MPITVYWKEWSKETSKELG